MKTEDIYDKAFTEYPIKDKLNKKAVGTYDANYPRRKAFIAGAEWMYEEMIENPDGGALLYAVVKTAERTKKEMIDKAADWIGNMVIEYLQGDVTHIFTHEMISDFRKAMQDENK